MKLVRNKEMKLKRAVGQLFFLLVVLLFVSGCGPLGSEKELMESSNETANSSEEIVRYTGEKSDVISSVYTSKRELTLTFNGMADKKTMGLLLDELDHYGIPATFFLPGLRVAEEPDVANYIVSRGYEIENNTLNQLDMSALSYEQIYKEIKLSNDVIEKETGVKPRYIRTKSGDYNDDIRLVTAQLGMDAVVSYNINPKDWDMKDAKSIGEYVERYVSRGGIISLNTHINPEVVSSIAYIAKAAEDIGYKFITLNQLIENGGVRKPLAEIEGFDAVKVNLDYENEKPILFYNTYTNDKVISLTFDDWASDKTVTAVLDILDEYDLKATFFLIGSGVERNPNLARAILDAGHEVASHSYSHQVVTEMTPIDLQEDLVKAHEVLTEAIQQQPTMLFRPATGEINEEAAKIITATGYPVIALYDVTALDWDVNNKAKDIVQKILARTKEGSVVLLHIQDNKHTIEALPTVIESLQSKGYRFVTMSELVEREIN